MDTLSPIFCRITKVDEKTRTVTGRATQEMVDRDNEVFDYASSAPHFKNWSAEVYQDTGGKSYGNVRAMHGNVCAGKLSSIDFDDAEKAIDVSAKIVDDNEWKKVQEGCYAGFSIGGKYTKKWGDIVDGKTVKRYTAVPSEISIVDRPCVPAAKFYSIHKGFDFVKADGSVHQIAFRAMDGAASKDADAAALGDVVKGFLPDDATTDGGQGLPGHAQQEASTDSDGGSAAKRDVGSKERQAAAGSGAALPETYAITKLGDAALNALFCKNQQRFTAALNSDELRKALDETPELKKSIYSVSSLASLIQSLKYLADGEARERKVEGDNSTVPEKLRDAAVNLLSVLSAMAAEEGTELVTGTDAESIQADAYPGATPLYRMVHTDIAKMDEGELRAHADALRLAVGIPDDLAKRGARNSAKDLELIQKVHDSICELGAKCQQPGPHAMDGTPIAAKVQGVQDVDKDKVGKNAAGDISSEGNARGAVVTSPGLPVESSNGVSTTSIAENTGATQATGKGKPAGGKAPSWMDDNDDDDASTKANKAKARMLFGKDDGGDVAASAKADGAVVLTAEQLGDIITKAVKAAKAEPGTVSKGVDVAPIPRVAPALKVVGQDGTVTKFEGAEGAQLLQKSVKLHPHDEAGEDGEGLYKRQGDNRTTSLIKAIHAKRLMIPDSDRIALGLM